MQVQSLESNVVRYYLDTPFQRKNFRLFIRKALAELRGEPRLVNAYVRDGVVEYFDFEVEKRKV